VPAIVEVAFPIAIKGLYDYELPQRLCPTVVPGMPVLVDLKGRRTWGVAMRLKDSSPYPELKQVIDCKPEHWTDSSHSLIKVYQWMAGYYQCDIGKVFKPLVRKRLIETPAKKIVCYTVAGDDDVSGLTPKQSASYTKLKNLSEEIPVSVLEKNHGIPAHMLKALYKKKVLVKTEKTVFRETEGFAAAWREHAVSLTEEQDHALEELRRALGAPGKPYLLHGITGSGKTYIYIHLAQDALARGKGVIILVPEIALTPQTIRRFRQAVGDTIAVIHSRMSDGERRDSLEDLVTGKKRVVIGARSAVLAPVDNLGLIVVDEEHDGSYKQPEVEPRYNARDVAVMRGQFQNALVVLGSATPSFETYQNALRGKYGLLELTRRFGKARLPRVEIIDMNREHDEKNNWTILSGRLRERIAQVLADKRQVILLLNRRGFSTFLLCTECGHVYTCPSCSVNLTFHKTSRTLQCHQCGFSDTAPSSCARCSGPQLSYKGIGIQKAEEHLKTAFPYARIVRMDQDTTRRKGMHARILDAFLEGEADILLGTQMVAKGLNFPGVALVGVLQADTGLHLPDFRASERTFQLLAQVAGRAGRNDELGSVVLQTYFPHEPCVTSAGAHDFRGFFAREIENRRRLDYPPFSKLARIVISAGEEAAARETSGALARFLARAGAEKLKLLGPSPAVLAKIDNWFRYSILIKSSSAHTIQAALSAVRKNAAALSKKIRLVIDIDPLNMT
jgi:primosomal protein N' (replication factor Y)